MRLQIDKTLFFDFPPDCEVKKWDEGHTHAELSRHWQFPCGCSRCPSHFCTPKKRKAECAAASTCRMHPYDGLKAADMVCRRAGHLYIIEVKDFASSAVSVVQDLRQPDVLRHYAISVAKKIRDTVFSVWCGSQIASAAPDGEMRFAETCRKTTSWIRFVFHFESPRVGYETGLFENRKAVSLVSMRQELGKYLGSALSDSLTVVDIDANRSNRSVVPWSVSR